jgi:hypothetical protein
MICFSKLIPIFIAILACSCLIVHSKIQAASQQQVGFGIAATSGIVFAGAFWHEYFSVYPQWHQQQCQADPAYAVKHPCGSYNYFEKYLMSSFKARMPTCAVKILAIVGMIVGLRVAWQDQYSKALNSNDLFRPLDKAGLEVAG